MSAADTSSPKTSSRMAWYHRLVQLWHGRLRDRREKRVQVIKARLRRIESRREVMLIMGDVFAEKDAGMILGCLCDIMQAERWEYGELTKELDALEQKLNSVLNEPASDNTIQK